MWRENWQIFSDFWTKFWALRTVQRSALCRSRRELSNTYFLAKFGFDTIDNEPRQVCPLSAYRSPKVDSAVNCDATPTDILPATPGPTPFTTLDESFCEATVGVDSCAHVSDLWTGAGAWNTLPRSEKITFCRRHYLHNLAIGVGREFEYG